MKRKFKLALFDWDGTLVNSRKALYACSSQIIRSLGGTPLLEEQFFREADSKLSHYQKSGVPETITRDELNAIWGETFGQFAHMVTLREGVAETLAFLRDCDMRIIIVSANVSEVIAPSLAANGIAGLVESMYCGACGKISELRQALADLRCHRSEAFYLDDTHEGVSAANAVGVTSIAIEGGFHDRERLLEANPDHVIASLPELPRVLGL